MILNKIILVCLIFPIVFGYASAQTDSISEQFLFYPKSFSTWETEFMVGLSVSNLPTAVVEEEISYSPMIMSNFRLGLPWDISMNLQFNTNYIANHGSLSFMRSFELFGVDMAAGAKYANWFGHLELDAIRLKSWGFILSPVISAGMDFDKFLVSAEIETQHSIIYTYSEDILLGTVKNPFSGVALKLAIEQPLWNDNWVLLALKLNYSKFYYQSWLSYSTVDEYFLYPEITFGFLL